MLFGPPNVAGPQRLALYRRLEERLRAVPGVQQVTVSQSSPVWGFGGSGSILIEGQPEPAPGNYPEMFFEAVSPSYFETFGIRLVAGRSFNEGDRVGQTPVLIINQEMARRFWPNESPIGKRVGRPGPNRNWMEVIGVVNDVGFPGSLGEPRTRLQGFRPIMQAAPPAMTVTLRTSMMPEALIDPARRAVAEIEPNLPLARVQTARSMIAQRMGSVSLLGTLLGAFAVLGVTLAAIGIYGVTSYSVVQRTNEFGIRTALGAQALDVIRLVIAGGMGLIFLGALIGAGGAYAVSRLLSAAIPTLPTRDPVTLVGVTVALVLVGLMACYLPARRATRIDPLAALREF
jgi:predicted permease